MTPLLLHCVILPESPLQLKVAIDGHPETVDPSQRCMFSSSNLTLKNRGITTVISQRKP
jgi:hypothetical protein